MFKKRQFLQIQFFANFKKIKSNQIQGLLYIINREWHDFVIFNEIKIIYVEKNLPEKIFTTDMI